MVHHIQYNFYLVPGISYIREQFYQLIISAAIISTEIAGPPEKYFRGNMAQSIFSPEDSTIGSCLRGFYIIF
ncbi:MAG: hypothetical protein NTU44_17385, partial [Bacteroidetes bacterium]|nr:hypothetical protein [Bacteroidota bacterium]